MGAKAWGSHIAKQGWLPSLRQDSGESQISQATPKWRGLILPLRDSTECIWWDPTAHINDSHVPTEETCWEGFMTWPRVGLGLDPQYQAPCTPQRAPSPGCAVGLVLSEVTLLLVTHTPHPTP